MRGLRRARRLVVVGGGPAGRAAVEAYRAAGGGGHVLLLTPRADEGWLDAHRVQLVPETALALDVDGAGVEVEVAGERITLNYDHCLLATGAAPDLRPRAELAVAAGLRLGRDGAIVTDPAMRTTGDRVYAAGAACDAEHAVAGRGLPGWVPGAAVAQGAVAGRRLAGEAAWWDEVPCGPLPDGRWWAGWGDGFDEERAGDRLTWYVRDGACVGALGPRDAVAAACARIAGGGSVA